MKKVNSYQNSDFLLEVIHNFVRFTASAETPQEVFWAVTKNFMQMLQIEDCVLFEAFPKERKIIQRAAHGSKTPEGKPIQDIAKVDYGFGIAGWVAEHQKTVCIGDSRLDSRYIVDDERRLSELSVPIQFNGELFGVIDSENSAANYYSEKHVQLFELIADLTANLLVRMRQKSELEFLKKELELILNEKKKDLEKAIEIVSGQENELVFQSENRKLLIHEVHHRVNNNLQILSSIINIYLTESENINETTLKEIQTKIQILSSIHLILLKSVENNQTKVSDFLLDLIASIRYMNQINYLILNTETEISILSLDTLIPLGILIHELVANSVSTYWEKGTPVEINICLRKDTNKFFLELNSQGDLPKIKKDKSNQVNEILIEAMINQLEGENLLPDSKKGLWKIEFQEMN